MSLNEPAPYTGLHHSIDRAVGVVEKPSSDIKLVPQAATHPRTKTRWYSQYGGATGAMVGTMIIIPGVVLEAFSAVNYSTGDPVAGTITAVLGTGLLSGFVGLGKLFARLDAADNSKKSASYALWQTWLSQTYGLTLTDKQNNELVNVDHPWDGAKMSKALTWGRTTISYNGVVSKIKLVGDDAHGYQVLLHNGTKYMPLPKQQVVAPALDVALVKPDLFPGYDRLGTGTLKREVDKLHAHWNLLNSQELSVEDRYTVNAIATDYLPDSLALFDKFKNLNRKEQDAVSQLFIEQVQAMDTQLTDIDTRTTQRNLADMKAHTLFLKNRKTS